MSVTRDWKRAAVWLLVKHGDKRRGARCLFLDRDGVINVDRGYVYRRENFEFMPGIFDLARVAVGHNWHVVVVTNQSGIGRGFYDEAAFAVLTEWMCARFAEEGAPLSQVYHCPFAPTEGLADHPWRKPNPGMLFKAAEDLSISLPGSVLVGDKESDMQAGRAAGVGVLVRLDGISSVDMGAGVAIVVRDLVGACEVLIEAAMKPPL